MFKDLLHHKGHANASLLKAIRQHEDAREDAELRKLLHHIILANRYWLFLIRGLPFALEEESQVPESLGTLIDVYRDTHALEIEWIGQASESDLQGRVETPFMPGHSYSVSEALMQVCLHSHGHRAQCSTRLRLLGGTPPNMDFILWLQDRPEPDWT